MVLWTLGCIYLFFNNDFYFFHYTWFTVLCQFSSIRYAYRYDFPRNYHGYGRLYSRLCGTCCRSVACVLHKEPFYCRLRLLCVGADTFFHTLRAVCTIAKNRHVFCTNIMKVTTVGKGQNCWLWYFDMIYFYCIKNTVLCDWRILWSTTGEQRIYKTESRPSGHI